MFADSDVTALPAPRRDFHTTSWTMVAAAGSCAPQAKEALEQLCRSYWQPLVSFAQRTPDPSPQPLDAEDAVQSFFAWLIETNVLERAEEKRGRFRSFLLAAFQQFRSRERAYWTAKKRCPNSRVLSLNDDSPAISAELEPYHEATPDRLFDHDWAILLLERAMNRLSDDWTRLGRVRQFQILKVHLTAGREFSGRELAKRLGVSEGAARVALYRLKQQFAAILREEVAQTVASPEEVDAELAHLRQALSSD